MRSAGICVHSNHIHQSLLFCYHKRLQLHLYNKILVVSRPCSFRSGPLFSQLQFLCRCSDTFKDRSLVGAGGVKEKHWPWLRWWIHLFLFSMQLTLSAFINFIPLESCQATSPGVKSHWSSSEVSLSIQMRKFTKIPWIKERDNGYFTPVCHCRSYWAWMYCWFR